MDICIPGLWGCNRLEARSKDIKIETNTILLSRFLESVFLSPNFGLIIRLMAEPDQITELELRLQFGESSAIRVLFEQINDPLSINVPSDPTSFRHN